MRKTVIAILLFLTTGMVSSQEIVYEGMLHEDILSIRWGGINMYDQYISPLLYKGQFIALQKEWWQHFKQQDWEHTGKVKLQGGRMYNKAYTNMIYALGVQGGWGGQFDFGRMTGINGLHLFLGPYLDADIMAKELINNVNKPYSIDVAVDIKAHAGIAYCFSFRNTSYRVRYTVLTSLLGTQFVPEYGQSYYEITEGIIGGTIGFSSLHNRLTLRHELTFDMQFPHLSWRIGVEHEYMKHSMNNLDFQREQVSLVIGAVFNYMTKISRLK